MLIMVAIYKGIDSALGTCVLLDGKLFTFPKKFTPYFVAFRKGYGGTGAQKRINTLANCNHDEHDRI